MFERWLVEEEGREFDVLLDLGRAEDYPLASNPWFFAVRIPMADQKEDGTPSATELHRLNTVENRIRELVRGRDGIYVGRRTGGGNRDLLFYLPGRPSGLEDRIRSSVGMEILFISKRDSEWRGYHALLPSERDLRQIEDLRTIDALVNADANPRAVHEIEHRVETSSAKGAEALGKLFEKLELEEVEVRGARPDLIVTGIQRTTLDVKRINRVSWILESKAPKARGSYLGWSANPEIEGPPEEDEEEAAGGGPDVDALIRALASEAEAGYEDDDDDEEDET